MVPTTRAHDLADHSGETPAPWRWRIGVTTTAGLLEQLGIVRCDTGGDLEPCRFYLHLRYSARKLGLNTAESDGTHELDQAMEGLVNYIGGTNLYHEKHSQWMTGERWDMRMIYVFDAEQLESRELVLPISMKAQRKLAGRSSRAGPTRAAPQRSASQS